MNEKEAKKLVESKGLTYLGLQNWGLGKKHYMFGVPTNKGEETTCSIDVAEFSEKTLLEKIVEVKKRFGIK